MTIRILACTVLFLAQLLPNAGLAEEPEPAFMLNLYPPDLVMRHAVEIHLSTDQRRAITKAVRSTQDDVLDLQWSAQEEMAVLERASEPIDEDALVAAGERLFALEGRIKVAHLRLLAQVKKILTPVQRSRLDRLRGPKSQEP